ncbi:MAG: PKD domain-containing protein [Ferruginibacter sp.]
MKKYLLILLTILCFNISKAAHITGGEMIYNYVGPAATPNANYYGVTLRLFRDDNCVNCAGMPGNVSIGIYNNDNNQLVGNFLNVDRSSLTLLSLNALPSCITNPPNLVYSVGLYTFLIELTINSNGYTIAYQTCCRVDGIMNVPNSVGATYAAVIPGTNRVPSTAQDNSARFSTGISVICFNKPFTLDFSATDPDGDSLVYNLCDAYNGGAAQNASFAIPAPPPYSFLSYTNGFSGGFPLGAGASINPQTGIISGIAPDAGRYVVSVCVQSFNRTTGALRGEHKKDFIVTVAPCDFAGAQLQPSYLSCDGFTFNFENLNTSPLNQTYFWDFGDGNTANVSNPSHTYTLAGIYNVKLVVNRGGSCSDSTISPLRVFPGFFPGINDNSPICKERPVLFNDATTTNFGIVNSWRWDFGNTAATNDTSRIKNPSYTYTLAGNYDVRLIVGSDRGCLDTIVKTIRIVDRPEFSITNDTLICSIDTLQLNAIASEVGSIVWSPNYMINNVNSFTPLVSPNVTTTYIARFADVSGCFAEDSLTVKVVNTVTLLALSDTTICLTDSIILRTNGDALQYNWSPSVTLNNASIAQPVANPVDPVTTYTVIGSIGKCSSQDNVTVRTVPYPNASVGSDTTICFGNSVQLQATGGSVYNWSPARFLSAINIPNPVSIAPRATTQYIVEVSDVLGCPKSTFDTIIVNVAQIIGSAGPSDTSVVLGQPLQLTATGGDYYSWTPPTWLNDPTIFNPLALPQDNIDYVLRVANNQGCFDLDTIRVKVFKIDPDILVPTGFSPNKDGNNEIFKPIPIGIRSLDFFRVYNRWGQLIFSTAQIGAGWDGTYGGAEQGPGTYVWYVSGTNYLGNKLEKKGTVVLIR